MNKRRDRQSGRQESARRRRELVGIVPNLRRFALSLAGNRADADDLLQSTVERLLTHDPPADSALLPYGLTACRNLWIDEIRYRRVRQGAGEAPAATEEASLPGERQVIGEISLDETVAALMKLPAEQRAVLELVAVEGCAYKEAAAILGIPVGTVMSRLARARAALIDATQSE